MQYFVPTQRLYVTWFKALTAVSCGRKTGQTFFATEHYCNAGRQAAESRLSDLPHHQNKYLSILIQCMILLRLTSSFQLPEYYFSLALQ